MLRQLACGEVKMSEPEQSQEAKEHSLSPSALILVRNGQP